VPCLIKRYVAFAAIFVAWLGLNTPAIAQTGTSDLLVTPETSVASAFMVAPGYLVTAYHAVRDRQTIYLAPSRDAVFTVGRVVGFSEDFDVALIRSDLEGASIPIGHWVSFPTGAETYVIGFPKIGNLVSDERITAGIFNGYQDFGGREDWFQLSAEIHRGNSGSPVIGPDGSVYGVISHKLDAEQVIRAYGDFPQNVNFALKSSRLIEFLDLYGVEYDISAFNPSVSMRPMEIYQQYEQSIFLLLATSGS
jgi:S1-C subfamily serine protease